jgi:nucleotide-binding universal stress UspA family protein
MHIKAAIRTTCERSPVGASSPCRHPEIAMAYKTILVYLNSAKRAAAVLEAALQLAWRHEAHLIGLHVVPQVTVPAVVPFEVTGEIIDVQRKALEEQAAKIADIFRETKRQHVPACEWRMVRASHYDVASIVDDHGRAADLIVAPQSDPNGDIYLPADVTEDLLMESGRPVIVVPKHGRITKLGETVLLAWNNSRESARAAFDALPLLKSAKIVKILTVDPPRSQQRGSDLPASEIATSLARHGVKSEADITLTGGLAVADGILAQIDNSGADLLVMGGYGHSRLRETVFGGATHDMLEKMTVPVLISH